MRKFLTSLSCIFLLAAVAAASENERSEEPYKSPVVGSVPHETIGGVASGGLPWVVSKGEAKIHKDGKLQVEVRGLVLSGPGVPANLEGTTGPITDVRASLVCGGSGGVVVATTDPVPLTPAGDARIQAKVEVPEFCFGPIVLVRIGGTTTAPPPTLGAWIAASGL